MNSRIDYIDIAKGLTMLMVVFVHTYAEAQYNSVVLQNVNNFIMAFFMPAFFVYSGMFVRKEKWRDFFAKKSKTLLVPLLFFYLLGYLFSAVVAHVGMMRLHNEFAWTNIFNIFFSKTFSNGALWFLAALLVALTIVQACLRIPNVVFRYMALITFAIIGMSWNTMFQYRLPFYVDSGCYAVGYLLVGHLLIRVLKCNEFVRDKKTSVVFLLTFLVVLSLQENKSSMMVATWHGSPVLSLLVGTCGAIMTLAFSALIQECKFLSFVGKNSIIVLCVHFFFIKPVIKFLGGVKSQI